MASDMDWLYWTGWAGVILVLLAAFVREIAQVCRKHRRQCSLPAKSWRTPGGIR